MKRFIIAAAIAISVFVSCSERNEGNPILEEKHITIKAFGENAVTRTTRDSDGKILWSPNEAISLFYHTGTDGGSKFISVNEAKAAQTDFSGVISVMSGVVEGGVVNPRYFYGIYPYNTENSVDADGKIVTVVRDNQDGVPNTFADGHYVSIGKSQGLEMGFYNLCGGFKFRLTREDVTKVTLKGNNGEILGGKVKVVVGDDNVPLVDEIIDGKTELVMTCPEGSVFQTGVDYFFVILPQTLSKGLTFTMETSGGLVGERKVETSVEIIRSLFSYANDPVDTGVEYALSGNIVFADPAVKAICVAHWDTNGDGELSYAEAAAVKDIVGVFTNNTEIESFEEFRFFTGLQYLDAIGIEDTYTSNTVFYQCTNLKRIVLPSTLNQITTHAFSGCVSLTSITIPDSITAIGRSAFYGCSNLTEVTLPDGLTHIGKYAFYNCGLKSINLPDGLTTIGDGAFMDCKDLSITLYISESISSAIGKGEGAFARTGIQSVIVDCSNSAQSAFKNAFKWGDSTGQNSYETIKVVTIRNDSNMQYSLLGYLFNGFSRLGSVVLPEGLKVLSYHCFWGCSGLKNTDFLPNSLVAIGNDAFHHCVGLTSAVIPEGVLSIRDYAFASCTELTNISLPSGLTSFGKGAFEGCKSLTSISIPNLITQIPAFSFRGCSALTSITLPEGIVEIGDQAFNRCSGLQSFLILATAPPSLGADVLSSTNNCPIYVPAASVDAYKSAEGWSDYADRIFAIEAPSVSFGDPTVKSICVANWDTNQDGELSESEMAAVTSLGDAFKNNTSITSFDELRYFTGLTALYDSFSRCSNLTTITLPESVKTISGAFYQCSSLVTVNLPSGLQTIGSYSFVGCTSLKSVTIPASVTSIGSNAFASCTGLEQIVLLPTTPPTFSESCFYNVNCPIYVPKGTLDAYKEAGIGKIPVGLLVEMTQ